MDFGTFFEWNWVTTAIVLVALGTVMRQIFLLFDKAGQVEMEMQKTCEDLQKTNQQIAETNKQIAESNNRTNQQIAESNNRTNQQIAESNNQANQRIDVLRGEFTQRFDKLIVVLAVGKNQGDAEEPGADFVTQKSPVCLSPEGDDVAVEICAEAEAARIAKDLLPRALDMEPLSIQEMCQVYALVDYKPSAEVDKKIQAVAYERGCPHYRVLNVLAIVLRDKLLEEKEKVRAQD